MNRHAQRTTKTPPVCIDQASGRMIHWRGVVKMQSSLSRPVMILVYDETRTIMGEFPAQQVHLDLVGEAKKVYLEVLVFDDGAMEVLDTIKGQDW